MLRHFRALLFLPLLCPFVQMDAAAQTSNQVARKFDEFGDILLTDIKARADAFAIELQNKPGTKGFIIVYRSHRDLPGISYRYANRMKDYVVMTRGIDEKRIVLVDGGESDCLTQELWIVPSGTTPTPKSGAYQRTFVDTDSAQKFDELSWGTDDMAPGVSRYELDAYTTALRTQPRARAYVIAYNGYYAQRGSYQEDGKVRRYMHQLTKQRFVPVFEANGRALVRPTDGELAEFLL